MKKDTFYSLWFRIVIVCFFVMVGTFLALGFAFYLLLRFGIITLIPRLMTGVRVLVTMAVLSVIAGTILNLFIVRIVVKPVTELSDAMGQVAEGDYDIRLDTEKYQGEIRYLREDFNQMVQELNETKMLRSDFISSVSHEFKTPLATISGYATLLQDDTLTREERDEYLKTIIQTCKGLSTMTGNILSLTSLEHQDNINDREVFRVDEQIREVVLGMEPLWAEKNLTVTPELDEISWNGNREMTNLIWSNLLNNAIKFTPAGGEIIIKATIDRKWLTVAVQDSGCGMTPEVVTRIFDKFYQGDASHRRKGNGLGLALVHRIVTLYEGAIDVKSEPDLGSRFTVRLPSGYEKT
ncbi:MAG: HAMP domain-containing histidine kinase [Lachnospiraceae bacterium]|nr:HAMP domain-containing histidine kinase [Lachnospiraceae bacterium]